jgi:chorismate mutase
MACMPRAQDAQERPLSGKVRAKMDSLETLDDLRKSIDNIDNAIMAMFAERFKVTEKVGLYKAKNGLPAKDVQREAVQLARIADLAKTYGLDPEFAQELLVNEIDRVVASHESIAREYESNKS